MDVKQEDKKYRCEWSRSNPLLVSYHDTEWGVPVHDDRTLFEFLILEGAQAGLGWLTILNKRENYRKAFSRFDAKKIAHYGAKETRRLLANPGIVRNRLKVLATIGNAKAFLNVQKEFGSFDRYIWQFAAPRPFNEFRVALKPLERPQAQGDREPSRTVGGKPIDHHIRTIKDIPSTTKESDAMSKNLLKRGFKFVGPTICYAYMQAVGMVNDHETKCFRYKKVA